MRTMVRIGRRASDGVIEAVGEEGTDLVIFGWAGPRTPAQAARGRGGGDRGAALGCELATAAGLHDRRSTRWSASRRATSPSSSSAASTTVGSILVPVRGGPHAELAMRLARDLGKRFGAQVVVMHVVPKGIGERALAREQEALDAFVREHGGGRRVNGLLREADERADHDHPRGRATTTSSSWAPAPSRPTRRHGSDGRYLFGSVPEAVVSKAQADGDRGQDEADARHMPPSTSCVRRRARSPHADAYVERSHALPIGRRQVVRREHVPRRRVQRRRASSSTLKEKAGLTISVGLPALNEERTIGLVIRRIKGALVDRVPLIDQLRRHRLRQHRSHRARSPTELGVPVVRHSQILPEVGTLVGKGEALWKSLHVLDGDIVAWIDTDISNIQPRFVFGLLGPLLREPRIQYVKGFYQRPIKRGRQAHPGGRRSRHRAHGAPAHQPLLPRAVGHDPAALRRVRRAPRAARERAVLHRLRASRSAC